MAAALVCCLTTTQSGRGVVLRPTSPAASRHSRPAAQHPLTPHLAVTASSGTACVSPPASRSDHCHGGGRRFLESHGRGVWRAGRRQRVGRRLAGLPAGGLQQRRPGCARVPLVPALSSLINLCLWRARDPGQSGVWPKAPLVRSLLLGQPDCDPGGCRGVAKWVGTLYSLGPVTWWLADASLAHFPQPDRARTTRRICKSVIATGQRRGWATGMRGMPLGRRPAMWSSASPPASPSVAVWTGVGALRAPITALPVRLGSAWLIGCVAHVFISRCGRREREMDEYDAMATGSMTLDATRCALPLQHCASRLAAPVFLADCELASRWQLAKLPPALLPCRCPEARPPRDMEVLPGNFYDNK